VTEIDVGVLELIVAAVPPKVTVVGVARLLPVIITVVPPVLGPEVGLIREIVGADIVVQENQAFSLKKCSCVSATKFNMLY
jgi:hypothetical protein